MTTYWIPKPVIFTNSNFYNVLVCHENHWFFAHYQVNPVGIICLPFPLYARPCISEVAPHKNLLLFMEMLPTELVGRPDTIVFAKF